MGRIIGIDLGTTNSLAAVWEDGESKLIPNAFGEYLTPSVVSFDEDGTVYVGKTAKERLMSHPENTASIFKRFMGTSKTYKLANKEYRPEELSAFVLRKLKEDAEAYLQEPVEEAIISVPAYFNDMGRNATKRAGVLAGLKVERIINEPSAAALACQQKNEEEDAAIMVFDFGGGTLDVSLVECFDNVIEILAVSGDNHLGGQDFDDALARHFVSSCGWEARKLTPETKALLRNSAEKCKRDLTESKTAEMVVTCEQGNAKLEVSRKDLVTIGAELFERVSRPVRRVLTDGKIENLLELNYVVLVGGSCKMPVVQQYLRHLLGSVQMETMYPDYMVALGAGICAGIKEREEEVKDMLLTDICPFSLGTGIHNEADPDMALMSCIIPRNTALPCSKEAVYVNSFDNQTKIDYKVYQGEAMYEKDNILLGHMEFDIPPRPKGTVKIKVRYTYDINGVLEVDIEIPLTGEKRQLIIVNKELGMSQEEIDQKLKSYEQLKMSPMDQEENKYVVAWGERLFMQCNNNFKEEISRRVQYFVHTMKENPYQIPKVRKYLMVFLATVEQYLQGSCGLEEEELLDGSWYTEEDEEEREVDEMFQNWDDGEDDR